MVMGGVFTGKVMEEKGWFRFFALLTRPLLKLARLPQCCSSAIVMAFASGYAGEALLSLHYRDGELSKVQVVVASMILNLPLYLSFIPLLIGIIYPLAGWPGMVYLAVQLLTSLFLMGLALLASPHLFPEWEEGEEELPERRVSLRKVVLISAKDAIFVTAKILLITGPVMGLTFLLVNMGFFQGLQESILAYIKFPGLSPQGLTISVAHAFHIAGGAAVAGSLLKAHLIGAKEVVLAMMLGNVIGTPFRSLRLALPRYMALYPLKMALIIVVATQGIRMCIVIVEYFLLYLFW